MSKAALDAQRMNAFRMDPKLLIIDGYDNENTGSVLVESSARMTLDPKMVANIGHYGVKEPVLVRKDGKDESGNDRVVVIDGRRRVIHAREWNRTARERGGEEVLVPVIVERVDDGTAAELMVTLNAVRLQETPLEEARKMSRLMGLGRSEEQLALAYGYSIATIKQRLALLDCDRKVLTAVEQGKISATAAVSLSRLPRDEQVTQVEAMIASGVTTVQAARIAGQGLDLSESSKPNAGDEDESPETDDNADQPRSARGGRQTAIRPGMRELRKVIDNLDGSDDDEANTIVDVVKWALGEGKAPRLVVRALAVPKPKRSAADRKPGKRKRES